MKRAFAILAVVELVLVLILLRSAIKSFLWTHPWWHSFLASLPAIALVVLSYFELRHSTEANSLRKEANVQRGRANQALALIANHTKKTLTKAE